MFKKYFLILLLEHILGDYYFQTDKIAKDKSSKFSGVLKHSILYGIATLTAIVPVFSISFLYVAIGFVLTGKSIALYDKISKDQTFAEYYLLGNLLSTIIIILAYFIFI